jgi:predicted permease
VAVLACVLLAGVAPALEGVATPVSEGLKASSSQAGGSRGRLRHSLLALQAALSIVLLIGAGLFVRSLRNVATRDVGVDFAHAMYVSLNLDQSFTRPQQEELYRVADEQLSAMPGVANVALVRQGIPLRTGSGMSIVTPEKGRLELKGGGPYYSIVTSDYFATIGTTIVRGRGFTEAEDRTPSRSLIVNRVIADAYWPGEDPVGKCARLGSDTVCSTIVGVTGSAMLFRMVRDDRGLLYIPPGHVSFGNRPPAGFIVRAAGNPTALVPAIRRLVQGLASNMPYASVEVYSEMIAWQLQPWRLGATMFTAFGLAALLIAGIGLYSVMAYGVSHRTREIGVRMALGAQAWDVIRLVAWQSSRAVAIGLALGTGTALVASRWVAEMLYETSPRDPAIIAGATLALAATAVVASIIPARRSASVDPANAIRTE